MNLFFAGYLCGAASAGFAAYYLTVVRKPRPAPPPPPDVVKPVDTHGHPFDIVSELAERLPRLNGALWEYGITFNPAGEPMLFLNLLDMDTVVVVASTAANLRWRNPELRFAWATDYAQFGDQYTADWARREIVLPLLDWAKAQANKHGGGEVERYGIQS